MRRRHAVAVGVFTFLTLYYALHQTFSSQHEETVEDDGDVEFDSLFVHGSPPNNERRLEVGALEVAKGPAAACSMTTCFNWTKCGNPEALKFYVYPSSGENDAHSQSEIYANILQVLRLSPLHTDDPAQACLFILSIDTLDRDRMSDAYVKNVNSRISALPQDVWRNGTNHLIINLYFGTYPHYSIHDLGFNTGKAMIAWASSHYQNFRHAFDIAFPLFHKDHPLRSPVNPTNAPKAVNKYFATFKGKRYVYGIGSETRDLLHHFHDNASIIVATTCRHNTDWKKYEDSRCSADNRDYDRWAYNDLMENSTFCFVPRGRRLGSYRFLETLRAGCLPVVLSDGWMLPFSETIDWSQAAIIGQERTVLFALDHLYAVSEERILRMKRHAKLLYHRYFSSVEKIVLTSVEVVFERCRRATTGSSSIRDWNSPVALLHYTPPLSALPTFTVVVHAINSASSRLNRIVREISRVDGVRGVVVLWPTMRGPSPNFSSPRFPALPIRTKQVEAVDQGGILDEAMAIADGDFVVSIDERVRPSAKELIGALKIASRNPSRFVSFYCVHYRKLQSDPLSENWEIVGPSVSHEHSMSIGLLYYAIVHRRISTKALMAYHSDWFMPQCSFLLLNFLITDLTLEAPMWLERRPAASGTPIVRFVRPLHAITPGPAAESWVLNHNHSFCFNRMVTTMYDGNPPLLTSQLRYALP